MSQNVDPNQLLSLKVHGVLIDPNTDTQIVVLRDEKNSEVLPIWVGTAEGTSIRLALEEVVPPRPMSHDLIYSFWGTFRFYDFSSRDHRSQE